MTYLQCDEIDKIENIPFLWGNQKYNVGQTFLKIGEKKRTSLSPGYKMEYAGQLDGYILFKPIFDHQNKLSQPSIFKAETNITYLAPAYVTNEILLMQSSENGFWDIRL